MGTLQGSDTLKNIRAAFQGESMARSRYAFYAEIAKKEGNEEIAQMFEKMEKNETMHAKLWYKLLNDGIGGSAENIQEAAKGENTEWSSMYPAFAEKAKEEGFDEIARLFEQVAAIEKDHEKTFLKTYMEFKLKMAGKTTAEIEEAKAQNPKKEKQVYRCMFCGAVYEQRPDVCSVCQAIGAFERGSVEE